jgi:sugar O-acyltransferase (sialic acid O-acetyltransferase NeuD family)
MLCGIFGAGGFGKEVMPLVQFIMNDNNCCKLVFVVEDEFFHPNSSLHGYEVISMTEYLNFDGEKYYCIAIANSHARERIDVLLLENGATPIDVFAESSIKLKGSTIGPGAIFCHFSHITSDVKVGRQFHCNYYSYVAHDVIIGDYVTFAPGVKCNGGVQIEDHAYIGSGAVIKDATNSPVVIGKGAVVGMGAVVTKSVPPGVTVIGNPAKPLNKSTGIRY